MDDFFLKNFIVCFIQVSQMYPGQQSTPSFPLNHLKVNSTGAVVTNNNGNHFLVALTNHNAEHQRTYMSDSKTALQILLQVQNSLKVGLIVCILNNTNTNASTRGYSPLLLSFLTTTPISWI